MCSDPVVKRLREYGYCLIRLPRSSVAPLQILTNNRGELEWLGQMVELLLPGEVKPPAIETKEPTVKISGAQTGRVAAAFVMKLLGGIVSGFGGSSAAVDTHYGKIRTAKFAIDQVVEEGIDIVQLDQYLAAAVINPRSKYISNLLESSELYVISSVLKSCHFRVEAQLEGGGRAELKAESLQKDIGGEIKVTSDKDRGSLLVYEGKEPIAFAFKAYRLIYEDGSYERMKQVGGVTLRDGEGGPDRHEVLIVDAAFVNV